MSEVDLHFRFQMLKTALEATQIDLERCAHSIGVSPQFLREWSLGQRPIPESMITFLSTVFGFDIKANTQAPSSEQIPAVWLKLRAAEVVDADRESVLLIKRLAFYFDQLEQIRRDTSVRWKSIFEEIGNSVGLQLDPREQGRQAARLFREKLNLSHGAKGSGDLIRGLLRHAGIIIFETPIKESRIEGCCFFVGPQGRERPCVFANTHHVSWFRRNAVLMHEVCHAIFDARSSLLIDITGNQDQTIQELRADSFAQETLAPKEVLHHIAQARGIKWPHLTAKNLAMLMADLHVEQKLVLRAAVEAGYLPADLEAKFCSMSVEQYLPEFTDHALSTPKYLEKIGREQASLFIGKRNTTLTPRTLRLPVWYINVVVDAFKERQISLGKAAEILLIDDLEFSERFCPQFELVET